MRALDEERLLTAAFYGQGYGGGEEKWEGGGIFFNGKRFVRNRHVQAADFWCYNGGGVKWATINRQPIGD